MDASSRKQIVCIHIMQLLLLAGILHEELRDDRFIKYILNGSQSIKTVIKKGLAFSSEPRR